MRFEVTSLSLSSPQSELPWALRTRIDETAIIDSTGIFWMEFLRRRRPRPLWVNSVGDHRDNTAAHVRFASESGHRFGFIPSASF